MCAKLLAIVLGFGVTLLPITGEAAPVPLGVSPTIGGFTVSCGGVPTWEDNQINDIAIATPAAIVLNPALGSWPPVVQLFVYAHECAHHFPNVGPNENAADCVAIKMGRDQGWITVQGLQVIQAYFSNSPGNWSHLPGPYRIQQMQACYQSP